MGTTESYAVGHYEIGQIVDLVIDGKRNRVEVIGVSEKTDPIRGGRATFYDLHFETESEQRFIAHDVQEKAIVPFEKIGKNPLNDPANHDLWVLLNEIKRGRPAADQLWLQQHIDQLKVLSEAQVPQKNIQPHDVPIHPNDRPRG